MNAPAPIPSDCYFRREHRQVAELWEPLPTDADRHAKPYCCYFNTVIFYRDVADWWDHKVDEVEYRFYAGAWVDYVVWWRGSWWEIATGTVVWRDGRWWMAHRVWRNTRLARRLNGEGWIDDDRGPLPWWSALPRRLRDVLRQFRVIPGRPARGQEHQMIRRDDL